MAKPPADKEKKKSKVAPKEKENKDVEMEDASTSKTEEPKSQKEIDALTIEGISRLLC